MFEGNTEAKVLIVSDFLRIQENAEQTVLAGERKTLLQNALRRAGIVDSDVAWTVIHPSCPPGGKDLKRLTSDLSADRHRCHTDINASKANVIVPLGNYALEFITGLDSIDKQHCSILQVKAELGQRKAIPLFHTERVQREFSLTAYLSFGAVRIAKEMTSPKLDIPERKFLLSLDLNFSQVIDYLETVVKKAPLLSVDVETGSGFVNTVGFAISPLEAIAIETHPDHAHFIKSDEQFHKLWQVINSIWSSQKPKIAQNALFESQWASRYGIRLHNVVHDTMWCMKFLHPELEKGLANVGRLYTRRPYWKDDHSDWNNIRNWRQHLNYNCSDTCGTFEGYLNQRQALVDRKLDKLFYNYIMKFFPLIEEMCFNGLAIDENVLDFLRKEADLELAGHNDSIAREFLERTGRLVNLRSPKQLQAALKEIGIQLPTKVDKKTKETKETADKKALTKLKRKYPSEPIIGHLIESSRINKLKTSYLDFQYEADKKIRYSIDPCGTETGRFSAYCDPWGNGFNPQTVPKKIRKFAISSDPNEVLVQIDLKQAESRYVAYEAPEPKLIEMLESGRDVHSYVASGIFKKAEEMVNKNERQLGKKSGHAANYGVGPRTFAEACLVEMGIVLTEQEARRIIDGYYQVFPGIRRRQANIQAEVRKTRCLTTPIGRVRHFYGRMNDQLFREAYAHSPQSVIPDITNHLMLYLDKKFPWIKWLLQVHDSLLMQVPRGSQKQLWEASIDYAKWHPEIILAGGKLIIPIDMEVGNNWLNMEKYDG